MNDLVFRTPNLPRRLTWTKVTITFDPEQSGLPPLFFLTDGASSFALSNDAEYTNVDTLKEDQLIERVSFATRTIVRIHQQ